MTGRSPIHRRWSELRAGAAGITWWHRREPDRAIWEYAVTRRLMRCGGSRIMVFLVVLLAAAAVLLPDARPALIPFTAAMVLAFFMPAAGCCLLPAALLLPLKLPVTGLGGELLFLRLDHGLLAGLLLHLALRDAVRPSRHYTPLLCFLIAAGVSVLTGLARDTLSAPLPALAYYLHLIMLGGIFVAAYSLGGRTGRAGVYAWCLPVILLAAFGILEARMPVLRIENNAYRTYEHFFFDGQANHAAGVLAMGAGAGLCLVFHPRWRVMGLALTLLCCAALPGSRSREGFAALAIVLAALAALRFPRLIPLLFAGGVLIVLLLPDGAWENLAAPGGSLSDRMLHWREALNGVRDYPVFGMGPGARHRRFYDNQYVFLLAETGFTGLLLFLWWLASLARGLWQRSGGPGPGKLWAMAALAALAGIAVQGLAAVSFLSVMPAAIFYWLAGFALAQREPAS
jgi:hypothetical protein